MDTEKVNKIWQIIKTVVEIILAGIGGLLAGASANAMGLTALL